MRDKLCPDFEVTALRFGSKCRPLDKICSSYVFTWNIIAFALMSVTSSPLWAQTLWQVPTSTSPTETQNLGEPSLTTSLSFATFTPTPLGSPISVATSNSTSISQQMVVEDTGTEGGDTCTAEDPSISVGSAEIYDGTEAESLGMIALNDVAVFPVPNNLSYAWHRELSISALESAYKVTLYWADKPSDFSLMRERITRSVGSVWEERHLPTSSTMSYAAQRLLCLKYAPAEDYLTQRKRILYVRRLIERLEAYARSLSMI